MLLWLARRRLEAPIAQFARRKRPNAHRDCDVRGHPRRNHERGHATRSREAAPAPAPTSGSPTGRGSGVAISYWSKLFYIERLELRL